MTIKKYPTGKTKEQYILEYVKKERGKKKLNKKNLESHALEREGYALEGEGFTWYDSKY